jgi:hypothetical protein
MFSPAIYGGGFGRKKGKINNEFEKTNPILKMGKFA